MTISKKEIRIFRDNNQTHPGLLNSVNYQMMYDYDLGHSIFEVLRYSWSNIMNHVIVITSPLINSDHS